MAGARSTSGLGPGDVFLGSFLAGLFLCYSRVDGVAEALGRVTVSRCGLPPGRKLGRSVDT